MAFLDKLLHRSKKLGIDIHEKRNRDRFCQITSEQVRLLLFKECDWRGRKLLFDSSSIQKVPAGKNDKPTFRQTDELPCIVEVTDGFSYLYKGPSSDASVLGEMIFGAVAMNCRNVSLKIHVMDEPRRLMCTKIFFVPTSRRISRGERKNDRREAESCSYLRNESKPLNVPTMNEEGALSLSSSMGRGDSGFCGDSSPYSSLGSTHDYFCMFENCDGRPQEDIYSLHYPPGRKLSISSNGSWQRRTFQNMATRFDLGHKSSSSLSVPTAFSNGTSATSCDSQVYSNSSTSGTSESITSSSASAVQKKNKLGLALLITMTDSSDMDLVRRCVEHSPQLQAMVCRLRLAILAAGTGGAFVSTLHRAAEDAAKWLTDLMYGPRLQPMWLNLVTSEKPGASNKMAESLLSDLCSVLAVGDTKNTNFFISTLVTYVLTYHLGWVSTVSPYDSEVHQTAATKLNDSKRPYNVLWAQLNDLCGNIGFPPRAARTIISGTTNTQFVNRLLVILTYFIRCGEVKRTDFLYQNVPVKEIRVVNVDQPEGGLKRTATRASKLSQCETLNEQLNAQNSDCSVGTLVPSEVGLKKSSTHANLNQKLSSSAQFAIEGGSNTEPVTGHLKRNTTMMLLSKAYSDSSLSSSISDAEPEQVIFVLGDNEKLVGLKNKSASGKSVKKSSKIHNEPLEIEIPENKIEKCTKDNCEKSDSPSKCCGQTLQHSKPIKHSGFKFEFDKYPQIVTNYMKSKNLEILDRHYIGKPGNLKLDNYQFDPMIVPPIQEERCETCVKCQLMESLLQTPTNASEMEYMNDIPRQSEPQHAKETIVRDNQTHRELSPKTFVRVQKENTLIVNVAKIEDRISNLEAKRPERKTSRDKMNERQMKVKQVIEIPLQRLQVMGRPCLLRSGYDASLLGGITDHYVPDLVLQGTLAEPNAWETDLRRDLDLTSHLNKTVECSLQSVAIVGDTNSWEVRIVGRDCCSGGMSPLVGSMLDALPIMWKAKVPAHECLSFLEGKLREFCVLSKTLAEMLMSTDFCDIATLTKSLNVDMNDVPLLMAVATTHTPQVATRYGISYR